MCMRSRRKTIKRKRLQRPGPCQYHGAHFLISPFVLTLSPAYRNLTSTTRDSFGE